MRDPERIKKVVAALEECWSEFPDLRFGQLISSIWATYGEKTGIGIFTFEDGQWLEWIRQYKEEYKDKYITK